ncbi:tRNA synthetases class I (M)-domain-containing protein [Gymnopilus junonius]|uniref:tRNA synthetases class I (M)-domain-containing protein n=1 Tax=Gymnopilus junonius TaxID=109634 RepID=A0A9P5NJ58_GYMJU|nr:tRNA synthetases class I (M)-domain-containing protein [Gymnopilus junonius]
MFYPNASPHIGHLYSLVTGDVFARYQRLKGRDVEYLTGTDEHGMKIQRAAKLYFGGGAGREKEFCDALSERFRDLGRPANINDTCFMRASSEEHHRAVDHGWRDLYTKGFMYKSQYSGWYSITDECFCTDAQVSSSPSLPAGDSHCVSLETGTTVEWTSEENYMSRLSAFWDALLEYYISNPRSLYPLQYNENVLAMLGAAPLIPDSDSASEPASTFTSTSTSADPTKVPVALVEDFELGNTSISRPRS